MDFWGHYLTESLYSPWLVLPEGESVPPIRTQKVFVYQGDLSDAAATMLSKMVAALNFPHDSVTIMATDSEPFASLQDQPPGLKLVMFGTELPGRFGEAIHWAGHQVVQTHSLEKLLAKPDLKRETWHHLKMFASLQ